MKVVIQRVTESSVEIEGKIHGQIGPGMMILVGIEAEDDMSDIEWLTSKIVNLRIFDDENGVMNRSIKDVDGEILVISQFTLHASTKKGNRPSFINAGSPDEANSIYEYIISECKKEIDVVEKGVFGADMKVSLLNDGPFTIILDSRDIL